MPDRRVSKSRWLHRGPGGSPPGGGCKVSHPLPAGGPAVENHRKAHVSRRDNVSHVPTVNLAGTPERAVSPRCQWYHKGNVRCIQRFLIEALRRRGFALDPGLPWHVGSTVPGQDATDTARFEFDTQRDLGPATVVSILRAFRGHDAEPQHPAFSLHQGSLTVSQTKPVTVSQHSPCLPEACDRFARQSRKSVRSGAIPLFMADLSTSSLVLACATGGLHARGGGLGPAVHEDPQQADPPGVRGWDGSTRGLSWLPRSSERLGGFVVGFESCSSCGWSAAAAAATSSSSAR